MSKRDWLPYAAVGGVAATLVVGVSIWFAVSAFNHETPTPIYSKRPACAVSELAKSGGGINNGAKAQEKSGQAQQSPAQPNANERGQDVQREAQQAACKAKQEAYDTGEDLKAQRWMAVSTAQTVHWSRVTFLGVFAIGLLDIILLTITLGVAFWATREAKRAADAAEAALRGSDRPHMIVHDVLIGPIEDGPEVAKSAIKTGFHFKNYGEDLAFLKNWAIGYVLYDVGDVVSRPVIQPHPSLWPIAPQQMWGVSIDASTSTITINEIDRAAINAGTKRIFAFGVMQYADAAGAKYEHKFAYLFRLPDRVFVPFEQEDCSSYT